MAISIAQVRRIRESLDAAPELTVILDGSGEAGSRLSARLLEHNDQGLKIQLNTALGTGMLVSVVAENSREPLPGRFRVRHCKLSGVGRYNIELSRETSAREPGGEKAGADAAGNSDDEQDCYEVLQVSPRADMDTIRRIFHVLAQRYHPDNRETGNAERFRAVARAYSVLSDPERRAAHDVRLAAKQKARLKIFDSLESTQGVQAEIRKRQGILRLLYAKRLTDPHSPAMRGRDFAEMLGCPIEHLEFSLWFLRENKLISRSDNNQFEITCQGVAAFEESECHFARASHAWLPPASAPA
jgi:hypothetical protein